MNRMKPIADGPRMLLVGEVVERYRISRSKLYTLIGAGRLQSYTLDGKRLIDAASLESLLIPSLASATTATSAQLEAARASRVSHEASR